MNQAAEPRDALVEVRKLSKNYAQTRPFSNDEFTVRAFEGVNLTIRRGKTLALVGESGAGKSALVRCLSLIEKPDCGEILFEGKSLLSLGKKSLLPLRRKVQLVFQNPTSALNPRMTASDIIAEPLAIHREGTSAEQHRKALDLMELVGLSPASAGKTPLEFSGGQRQRLAIARALALEPQLLILDEALSNLDAVNRDQILDLLSELQIRRSLTFVHVSHDLRLVTRFADDVTVMHEGKIVEQGTASAIFAYPKNEYTQELLAAMPSIESIYHERFAEASR